MLLAIDIGNTNIVFAVYDGETSKLNARLETDVSRQADDYHAFLMPQLEKAGLDVSTIDAVIASSVVPDINATLEQFVEQTFSCPCGFVSASNIGLPILLDKPEEAGSDRLVNAVTVVKGYQKAAIVIDFGTATTFDVVDGQGRYCGGVIAPGPNLSMEALHLAAAKLPRVEIEKPASVIGKNTIHAMQSGLYWGYVGMIEGVLTRLREEMATDDVCVIATGGLAPLFSDAIPAIETVDSDLTLRGLRYLHQQIERSK